MTRISPRNPEPKPSEPARKPTPAETWKFTDWAAI